QSPQSRVLRGLERSSGDRAVGGHRAVAIACGKFHHPSHGQLQSVMMFETSPAIISLLAFAAVTCLAFAAGQYFVTEARLNQRIAPREREQEARLVDNLNELVLRYFDEKRFKVEGAVRSKLRQELLRAGFFHPNAINYY